MEIVDKLPIKSKTVPMWMGHSNFTVKSQHASQITWLHLRRFTVRSFVKLLKQIRQNGVQRFSCSKRSFDDLCSQPRRSNSIAFCVLAIGLYWRGFMKKKQIVSSSWQMFRTEKNFWTKSWKQNHPTNGKLEEWVKRKKYHRNQFFEILFQFVKEDILTRKRRSQMWSNFSFTVVSSCVPITSNTTKSTISQSIKTRAVFRDFIAEVSDCLCHDFSNIFLYIHHQHQTCENFVSKNNEFESSFWSEEIHERKTRNALVPNIPKSEYCLILIRLFHEQYQKTAQKWYCNKRSIPVPTVVLVVWVSLFVYQELEESKQTSKNLNLKWKKKERNVKTKNRTQTQIEWVSEWNEHGDAIAVKMNIIHSLKGRSTGLNEMRKNFWYVDFKFLRRGFFELCA